MSAALLQSAQSAQALLAQTPPPLATMPYTLQAMQDATLALYQELADDDDRRRFPR